MKAPLRLITWNIQWGLGVDGRVDLARIADTARQMSDFDVLCLQEVSDGFASLKGNDGADQFEALARLLPGYQAVEGIAVDRFSSASGRQRFLDFVFVSADLAPGVRRLEVDSRTRGSDHQPLLLETDL